MLASLARTADKLLLPSAIACSLMFLLVVPWAFLQERLTWPRYERLTHLGVSLTLTLAIVATLAAITARRGYLPALSLALVAVAILAGRASPRGAPVSLAVLGLSPFVLLASWAIATSDRESFTFTVPAGFFSWLKFESGKRSWVVERD